jgi:hypothetical protein
VSILAFGGLFAYKNYLTGKIAAMDEQLTAAQTAIKDDLINQFIRLDTRLRSGQELLQGHVATSLLFATLQNQTVKNIQFADMTYLTDSAGVITVYMRGIAQSYNTLALQASIFDQNKYIKNALFSDINLNEKGDVVFTFKATISSELVAQRNAVQALTGQQP